MELVEREEVLEVLAGAQASACDGNGRLLLIAGEAGIGKTSVLQHFARSRDEAGPVVWGWCDPVSTPRPLTPFLDALRALLGPARLLEPESALDLLASLLDEVRDAHRPVLMILEDAHWADDASLDLLRLIGRRIHMLPLLLLVSYRDDEIGRDHPLSGALGALATTRAVTRVHLAPLSSDGVRRLAADAPVDIEALHRRTGGNPFFVSECLARGQSESTLGGVEDLMLERMARLSAPARELMEAAALLGRAEVDVLHRISAQAVEGVEAGVGVGLLKGDAEDGIFRHELLRQALLESLHPARRANIHRDILRALTEAGERDPARLAHHAEGAGNGAAARCYATAAAEHAASVGSHREAAFQYARALRFTNPDTSEERAHLLMGHARECAALDHLDDAVAGLDEAATIWRALGHRQEDAACWAASALPLVRLGRNEEADARVRRAIGMLEDEAPGRGLAEALRIQAHLRMLDRDLGQALHYGRRAIRLAKELSDRLILAGAHLAVGAALLVSGEAEGRDHLDRAIIVARDIGNDDLVAHAYLNIGSSYGEQYHLPEAERFLREGIAFAIQHDLDQHLHYMQAWLSLTLTHLGRWHEAEETAARLLAEHAVAPVSRIMALVALGRLRARHGKDDAGEALDEALDLALPTGTLQRLAPVRLARAEAAALAGDFSRAQVEAGSIQQLALAHRHRWHAAEAAYWLNRCGVSCRLEPWFARPFALELQGQWQDAANAWNDLGCTYEQARALGEGDQSAQVASLSMLDHMGARPAASALRRRMRRAGIRRLPRSPRPATLEDPLGLTARQSEVLKLASEGLTNGEIARRLQISTKTVDHHVSACLAKLGVGSRREASALMRASEGTTSSVGNGNPQDR